MATPVPALCIGIGRAPRAPSVPLCYRPPCRERGRRGDRSAPLGPIGVPPPPSVPASRCLGRRLGSCPLRDRRRSSYRPCQSPSPPQTPPYPRGVAPRPGSVVQALPSRPGVPSRPVLPRRTGRGSGALSGGPAGAATRALGGVQAGSRRRLRRPGLAPEPPHPADQQPMQFSITKREGDPAGSWQDLPLDTCAIGSRLVVGGDLPLGQVDQLGSDVEPQRAPAGRGGHLSGIEDVLCHEDGV